MNARTSSGTVASVKIVLDFLLPLLRPSIAQLRRVDELLGFVCVTLIEKDIDIVDRSILFARAFIPKLQIRIVKSTRPLTADVIHVERSIVSEPVRERNASKMFPFYLGNSSRVYGNRASAEEKAIGSVSSNRQSAARTRSYQ